ncbi:MAG: response regulator transcription factor [Ignavibacteriales bacterium]|nr:response regulator transcription factor [Ignavibacteriota bacterium]MCB9249915.1 response regulator transcription factor [Ignavibacteriales bacterium]
MMSKKKILLVEDDINLGSLLCDYLTIKKFDVNLCKNGNDGFDSFQNNKYDLCILDIMMPRKDGLTLAKEIRATDKNIPIIFLTAKSMISDKIQAFNLGADDYITKPFNTEELILRINAIIRRTTNLKLTNESQIINIGKYIFDYKKRLLTIGKKSRTLTSKESELLKLLCENNNSTLSRETALTTIWKEDNYFTSRSMDVYITKLRNYLKEDKLIEIVNVHGVGFKLILS